MKYPRQNRPQRSSIIVNDSTEGQPIERKIESMINNKEPIQDGMITTMYTDKKDGVLAGTNIRTDRFETALDAIDKINKTRTAQSEKKAEMKIIKGNGDGKTESTEGTNDNSVN